MLTQNITIPIEQIAALCRQYHVRKLSLFGSVLRGDFRPDSDIDVLVTFAPAAHWSLFDLVTMQAELVRLFGRWGVAASRNYLRRKAILDSAQVVYAA